MIILVEDNQFQTCYGKVHEYLGSGLFWSRIGTIRILHVGQAPFPFKSYLDFLEGHMLWKSNKDLYEII